MSLFKSSKETGQNVHDKILIYGPTHTGKTHHALSWPDPGLIDIENRGAHFADRYDFLHAQPHSMSELIDVLDEFRSGRIAVKTGVLDSYSVAFEKVKVRYTRHFVKDGKPSAVIDNVSVNRTIAPVREFIFSISACNLIVIAHAQQKYDYQGDNNLRARKEIEFLGDEKFRFAFDYVFRTEPTGPDPRTSPIKFHVEKSASTQLKVGDVLVVRPNEKLYDIFRARVAPVARAAETPAQHSGAPPATAASATPLRGAVTGEQLDTIADLAKSLRLGTMELADAVKIITPRRSSMPQHLTADEGRRLIVSLEQRIQNEGVA